MTDEQKITTHPPLRKGETFIGNTIYGISDYLKHIPGLVLRRPSYSIDGEKLEREYQALIAINESALAEYNRVMEKRLADIRSGKLKPWLEEKS